MFTMSTNVPCQEHDPDIWFSPGSVLLAQSICSSCPVKRQCLEMASLNGEIHGVWGGVDFSIPEKRVSSETRLCRKKLHHYSVNLNTCPECRKASYRSYDQKVKSWRNKQEPYIRKKIGDLCANKHVLTEDNIIIRSSDNATLCKKCTRSRMPVIPR